MTFATFFLWTAIRPAFAADSIVINEFSPGTTSDWIEIYNNSTAIVDLTNYKVRDSSANNVKEFSGSLSAGQFASVNFNNWLNNSGDTVKLVLTVDGTESTLEQISYGGAGGICAPSDTESIGRKPDGNGSVMKLSTTSRDASNNGSVESMCPSPTPAPTSTPSPTPTNTPAPSPSNTPTPSPKPTSTPKPTAVPTSLPTAKPSIILNNSDTENSISDNEDLPEIDLAINDAMNPSPANEPEVLGTDSTKNSKPNFPVILIITGTLLTLAGGILLAYQEIKNKSK